MKKTHRNLGFLIWIIGAITLFMTISVSSSLKNLLFNIAEWLLVLSTIYGIFLIFTNDVFKQKYVKIFYTSIVFLILVTHFLRVIWLAALSKGVLSLGLFFKPYLFWPILLTFIYSALAGLLVCVLLWFSKQPRRKIIKIALTFVVTAAIVLTLGHLYLERDLSEKEIYFNYEIDTLSEVQELAISKQKNVYLDFWHSGCGPCLQEFSSYDQFRNQVDIAKVHFLFIGVDRSIIGEKQRQRVLIEKYGLKGTHSFVGKKNFAQILDDAGYKDQIHGIKAFPHHMIIGKEGRVLRIKAGKPTSELAAILGTIK